jgi:hypothetical protein
MATSASAMTIGTSADDESALAALLAVIVVVVVGALVGGGSAGGRKVVGGGGRVVGGGGVGRGPVGGGAWAIVVPTVADTRGGYRRRYAGARYRTTGSRASPPSVPCAE